MSSSLSIPDTPPENLTLEERDCEVFAALFSSRHKAKKPRKARTPKVQFVLHGEPGKETSHV